MVLFKMVEVVNLFDDEKLRKKFYIIHFLGVANGMSFLLFFISYNNNNYFMLTLCFIVFLVTLPPIKKKCKI